MYSREWKRGRMMARLVVSVGIWLTASAYTRCSFTSGSPPPDPPDHVEPFGSSLTLHDVNGVETSSFVMGEPIRLDFKIVNLTTERQRVQFADSQDHDFLIVNTVTGEIVWKWSQGMAFTQAPAELTFESNASWTFSLYWPATLADGTQLPAGTYQARGALVFDGFRADPLRPNAMGSELERFTVR
jgi:hypothetical protein